METMLALVLAEFCLLNGHNVFYLLRFLIATNSTVKPWLLGTCFLPGCMLHDSIIY